MNVCEPNTSSYQENKRFLSRPYSEEEFVSEYKKQYHDKSKAKGLYLQILAELQVLILEGNVDSFKTFCNFVSYISNLESQVTLKAYYDDAGNVLKCTNLVILTCKYNKVAILDYLLDSNSNILNNLSNNIGKPTILPDNEDDTCHNAIYYAIRSSNVELLDILINKWPKNDFVLHTNKLDEILSTAYEELKLKHVQLSNEMELNVESKLIDLRFFSEESKEIQDGKTSLSNINERIELVLENISALNSNTAAKLDETFLFTTKFIAQNIYVLKRQLKFTYDRLPWEEIEYCLVSFVSSHTKRQEINLFYQVALNKSKIQTYLKIFAEKLQREIHNINSTDVSKLAELPNLKRENVISAIIRNNIQFEALYNDYKEIRDIHSLDIISNYIKLALSADPKEREGQLLILRALQVIGEHLKNSFESPKLSTTTSELLLLTLPKNTRALIINLRNSLSHAHALSKRSEIDEKVDVTFFSGIQNDIKKIDTVITDIFYDYKIKTVRILLKKIVDLDSLDELKDIAETLKNAKLETMFSVDFIMMEHKKLEKLINELNNCVREKTSYVKDLFKKIKFIINIDKSKSKNTTSNDYIFGFAMLAAVMLNVNCHVIDHNFIRALKFRANITLKSITPKMKEQSRNEIIKLTSNICRSIINSRTEHDEVWRIMYEMLQILNYDIHNIKWIEDLKQQLSLKRGSAMLEHNQNIALEDKYKNHLTMKFSELKGILNSNALNNQLTENFSTYKSNQKLQAVIEMLLLDITSILGSSMDYLTNNYLFVDDNTPLLTGKCLRNHLAHANNLVDVLLTDPAIAVFLNARQMTTENIIKKKKKIGKSVADDPSKLKDQYQKALMTIMNQEKMFAALEEGNLEGLESCLKNGSDINARSINFWTTLHFAAKGPNLEVVKYCVDQNLNVNVKDMNGKSPLHIAAAYGRANIVEFLIKESGMNVDDVDNWCETPLHIAAQIGHLDTVYVLLKNKANTNTQNIEGLLPIHCAIRNNHINVVKMMKDANVDFNEPIHGFTPLHGAAEFGYLELVDFFLKNKADVNAKADKNWTPLHAAAFNGHLNIVNLLIHRGADVNARHLTGCTALHYAVENGHEQIVDVLLQHRAIVNVIDKVHYYTPLHFAAKDGYEGIVKTLLKSNANPDAITSDNITPLYLAAYNGHMNIVVTLLKHPVDIHAKNQNYATALYGACESGNKDVVDLLIKKGAAVNCKAGKNITPLHMAALKGHRDITDLLIQNKASVNAQDFKGSTPLHYAARNGWLDIIHLLIQNKANISAKNNYGTTPLHSAAVGGCTDAAIILIKNHAEINSAGSSGITPLHAAIKHGHTDIVKLLLKNKAHVNAKDIDKNTPLHIAVETDFKDIIEILIANGADVNVKNTKNQTLLSSAIAQNRKKIVEVLIAHGANISAEDLSAAVYIGYRDIVKVLLQKNVNTNVTLSDDNRTLLHIAVARGHKEIMNDLITKGANVNATTANGITPLHSAALKGHKEIIEILISEGANVNANNCHDGTPLHLAVSRGHTDVVEVLLNNEADFKIKDKENRTSLEQAVGFNHLEIVKLLRSKKADINERNDSNEGRTLLHIAAQQGYFEIVKYLFNEGADINAQIHTGSKPIHIAAREGRKNIVEFLLNNGSNINDLGANNQTILHYTAVVDQLEVVNYLIAQGADVNAKDTHGRSTLHLAAYFSKKNVTEFLLKNNAIYNDVDGLDKKPLDLATNTDVINLLELTDKLFEAVKHNSSLDVENSIRAGAFVNAKNDHGTPLHYATWKGYDKIVNILLESKGNPNAVCLNGFTPLHYAAKFSHINIVKVLLFHGAIYNAVSKTGKTPLDFTEDKNIVNLFKLVRESFKKIEHNNSSVINDLNKIKDVDTIKAIMNARNKDNKSLIIVALHTNFSKVDKLKEILQDDVSTKINEALLLLNQENTQKALYIAKSVLEKRTEILGPDNPGTLDIQMLIANVLFKQGAYSETLKLLKDIFHKQKEMLGLNNKDTLNTRSFYALVLHKLGRDAKACKIFQELYQKQKELLGANHSDTLETQFHMALALERQEKYEEALYHNRYFYQIKEKSDYVAAIHAQNNIAMVLASQKNYEEALQVYKEVYLKKKALMGINHSDTLRTLHNIAGVLFNQGKHQEALEVHQELFNIQKKVLGPHNPDTLYTQQNIAEILFAQGKWISSFKMYKEVLDPSRDRFGPSHPCVLNVLKMIEELKSIFKVTGENESDILLYLQNDINIAACKGDIPAIQSLIKKGADINDTDTSGRTPLHFAINNGHIDLVNILLKNGADATQVTSKGNTTLHTAASNGYKEVIDILLQHVNTTKLNDFINAKTTASGTTTLHISAKKGFLDIVKSLLKHCAIYNIENKTGQTPLDVSTDQNITNLLKLIDELFTDVKNGNVEVIGKLRSVKRNELAAVTNARNDHGKTLLQVAITNKHKYITGELLKILKK